MSEPTIDLSAWSPRSRRNSILLWRKKVSAVEKKGEEATLAPQPPELALARRSSLTHQTLLKLHPISSPGCFTLTLSSHGHHPIDATENPSETHKIYPQICLVLLPVPSPISLKLLPFPLTLTFPIGTLKTTFSTTITKEGDREEVGSYALISAPQLAKKEAINALRIRNGKHKKENSENVLEKNKAGFSNGPTSTIHAPQRTPAQTGHPQTLVHSQNHQPSAQSIGPLSLTLMEDRNSHHYIDICPPDYLQLRNSLPDPFPVDHDPTTLMDPQVLMTNDPHVLIEATKTTNHENLSPPSHSTPTVLSPTSKVPPLPSMPALPPCQNPKTKTKEKKLPTRKSQRLQAKKRPACVPLKSPIGPRNKVAKLPFDDYSHEAPLGIDAAMAILQASGLTVNKEVEDMIQKVIALDHTVDSSQDIRPTTPIHDVIPPRAMPGDGIML